MSLPMLVAGMRRPLDCRPIAADASERGGGVSVGTSLTDEGAAAGQHQISVGRGRGALRRDRLAQDERGPARSARDMPRLRRDRQNNPRPSELHLSPVS
eukprot:1358307-Pyramimonas_sp.AAC.1